MLQRSFMLLCPILSLLHQTQSRVIQSRNRQDNDCINDPSAPVIAWPGESCHLDPTGSDLTLSTSEEGIISCSPVQHNAKCFPIWQTGDDSMEAQTDSRDPTPYKAKPIRQAPEQQTLSSGARSIGLRWPNDMQHAVFYTDQACHNVDTGRPEVTWHVERFGSQVAQCESPPAGLFRSVEFMGSEEYEAFSRKMRGQDGTDTKAKWKGVL
ncbi:MAG: hypothetical protein Q9222_007382 [Ikaeria aurantiellina]